MQIYSPLWWSTTGTQPADSASNIASSLSFQDFMSFLENYNNNITSAQKDINQDFFNQQKEYNSSQAALQREWEEYMSSTQYQRMVKDLEKAGLNKLLAYSQGPGSFGSGAMASVGLPSSSRGQDITSALTSLANNNANGSNNPLTYLFKIIFGALGSLSDLFGSINNATRKK